MGPKSLFMPWTLASLTEHEECFEQWCILQLVVGVAATFFIFLLSLIWSATTDDIVKMSIGTIIVNTLLRLSMGVLATWVIWFGVIVKRGCCCAVVCCCLGKPNILVVAIVEGIFALSTMLFIIQALGFSHMLLILAALAAILHLVTQIYLTLASFMVWLRSRHACTEADKVVKVGDPVTVGQSPPVKQASDQVASDRSTAIEEICEEKEGVQEV